MMDKIVWLAPVLSVVALLFAAYKAMYVSKAPAGTDRMQEIAAAIDEINADLDELDAALAEDMAEYNEKFGEPEAE